jgi:hypothetical protein
MKKPLNVILLLGLAAAPGFASVLFQGTFADDDQVALFSIIANTAETVTIETYSYAGGTVNSTVIPAGGFTPAAFLFYDQDTVPNVLDLSNGTCSQVGTDPATLGCNDIYFQGLLQPGTYTLALAVYNNTPVDSSLADGFVEDGNPGFTCVEAGTAGSFCDLTAALGPSRTGNYAIAITGADSVVNLPEPGSVFLLFAGGATIALRRRRSFNSRWV